MNTTEVTDTVCDLLAAAGVGVWRPEGPAYAAGETGIFYGPLGATPDRAIGVTCYLQTDDVETGRADRYMQIRYRGPRNVPNGADVIADAAFAVLHGLYRQSGIARITRTSTAPLGADSNGRAERTDNYQLILDHE